MRSTNQICSALTLTVMLASMPLQASAATLFRDDFIPDGDVRGRDRMPVRWSNGIARGGDLEISGIGLTNSEVQDLDIAEVSVRSVFELVEGGVIGIGARVLDSGYYGFVGTDSVDGSLIAGLSTGGTLCCTRLVDPVEVPFDPRQQDVAMQLDIFSDNIRLWVWPAEGTMPVEPLLDVNDSRLASGSVAVFVGGEDRLQPNPQDSGTGRFRYVHVADAHIPEPTTLLLSMLGITGPCCYRRRR